MATSDLGPLSGDERLIYRVILLTWVFWVTGVLLLVGPALGWYMLIRNAGGGFAGGDAASRPPAAAWLAMGCWIAAMAGMILVIVISHVDFQLGVLLIVKSCVGLAKGWGLLVVFLCIGTMRTVRPAVIFRATNVLGLQTLLLSPVFLFAPALGLPPKLYVSVVNDLLGGGHTEFMTVALYYSESLESGLRWKLFSPWAPAAAFIGCLSLCMAYYDRHWLWRAIGIAANLLVCWMAQSRLSYITLPLLVAVAWGTPRVREAWIYFCIGLVGMLVLLNGDTLLKTLDDTVYAFNSARASSSRVRATLQSIALQRWWDEAPLFGHGNVEPGSHLTEFMAIGTHHAWNGLLFTRGLFGMLCIAIPLAVMFLLVLRHITRLSEARAALCALLVLLAYSFGDTLDVLAYLFWPMFLHLGWVVAQPTAGRPAAEAGVRSAAARPAPSPAMVAGTVASTG